MRSDGVDVPLWLFSRHRMLTSERTALRVCLERFLATCPICGAGVSDCATYGCGVDPADWCPRTLCLYRPGVNLAGLTHHYTWTGRVPCTGRLVCMLCGAEKPYRPSVTLGITHHWYDGCVPGDEPRAECAECQGECAECVKERE